MMELIISVRSPRGTKFRNVIDENTKTIQVLSVWSYHEQGDHFFER
ncbi:MAG: hypothetical protein VKL42_11690 [Snowella sp.]|nr:hypothetical protein [Snowella sp.]